MAYVKIKAIRSGIGWAIRYVMNGDKTEEQLLVGTNLCTQAFAYRDMMDTKRRFNQTQGIEGYHLIQSFALGEVTPEQAMEIARELVQEHFADYECVIAVHVDKAHVHAHVVINSVNWETGKKYVSNKFTLQKIRETSDRICQEHGLSVIEGSKNKGIHYYEWLRNQRGYTTYRAMLEEDLEEAISMAVDIGNFYALMEQMGYEIKHGNRTSYSFLGAPFICPERKNPKYTEENIRSAIEGSLAEQVKRGYYVVPRPVYQPPKPHPKRKGFIALYYHYLYLLGKVQKKEYPPRVTPELLADLQRFEELKEQFKFLQAHGIETEDQLLSFVEQTQAELDSLLDQRRIFNAQKKKRRPLYKALADEVSLKQAAELYRKGHESFKDEYDKYIAAVSRLDNSGESRESLAAEKSAAYKESADLNREIRRKKRDLKLCEDIQKDAPTLEQKIVEAEQTYEAPDWQRDYDRER